MPLIPSLDRGKRGPYGVADADLDEIDSGRLEHARGAVHPRLLIQRARDADHAADQVALLDVGENALADRNPGLEEVLTDVGQYVAAGVGWSFGIIGHDRDYRAQRLIRHGVEGLGV